MTFRERLSTFHHRSWPIAVATHLGSDIPNETGPQDLKPSGTTLQRDQRFAGFYVRHRPPIHGYNCYGLVFAGRRTGLFDELDIEQILCEDGFEMVADADAAVGDVVLYRDTRGEHLHAAPILRFDRLLSTGDTQVPIVLSKFDSTSGEFEHRIDDSRWSGEPVTRTIHRPRGRLPSRKPGWRAVITPSR